MEFQKIIVSIFIFAVIGTSCTKELPVEKYDRGDVEEVQVEMGPTYDNQVWVDLKEAKIVKTAPKTAWDFAFLTANNEPYLVLNEALAMKAVITNTTDWNTTFDPNNYTFSADHANGDTDSIRAGQWWAHGNVVLIDLGVNASGNPRGYCKFQGISFENNTVTFKVDQLDGANENTASITLDNTYTQQEYSYTEKQVVQISPAKAEYDLIFTGYMEHFYEEGLEYQVTGVLLNRYQTSSYKDTTHTFNDITVSTVDPTQFSFERHTIGYDWKYYDFDEASYIILENAFVVQDQDGFTYKLRFTDFYNESGIKGHPKFEIQLL